ncbi:hypothetical protein OG539_33530 [Actinacidiphila glaucinigra]|uniref:hypothetical protein n=1 Tax=Actinacidiphila glaucinigra TaxID=235986 RepID=UPI00324EB104
MIDLLGPNAGIEEVLARSADIAVSGPCSLDLGGRHVDIEHIGFAQTDGDLVVRMREDDIVFGGNMLQAPPRHSRGCWRGGPTRHSSPTGASTTPSTTTP